MYVPTFQGLTPADLVRRANPAPSCFPFDARHQVPFYRARNAIYHLFRALRLTTRSITVLVPDYNSGNEVLAMRAAGAHICYYPIGSRAKADPNVVERMCDVHNPDVLYVIHYLGWPQPMRELMSLCRRRGMLVVEDCALALLSQLDGQPLGSFGDWSVFCLYKTLPVPNGALLVQNALRLESLERLPLTRPPIASVAGRTADLFVQRVRSRVDRVGGALETFKRNIGRVVGSLDVDRATVGDIGFRLSAVNLAMSRVTSHLLRRLDFNAIRERRIANFRQLVERLDPHGGLLHRELPRGACPLFLPLLVKHKPSAAEAMRRRGIQALEFWNEAVEQVDHDITTTSHFLRTHVLGLPVHQDLTPEHIRYMADHVSALNLRMAA